MQYNEAPYGVAAYRSRQAALRAQSRLSGSGLIVSTISTPREISIGCGVSIRFRFSDRMLVTAILKADTSDTLVGIYIVETERGKKKLKRID